MNGLPVALLIDAFDWHARELARALAARGVDPRTLRLSDCSFSAHAPGGLTGLPARPAGALVRGMQAGSFEQVTRRLGVLHALRARGVAVWNDPRAIERSVDKSMTSFLLANAGLPTPPAWAVDGRDAACALVAELGGTLVLKPLFGSQGRGLRLISRSEELPDDASMAGVYYLQRFVEQGGPDFADHRVLVIGGEPVAAMTRRSDQWITNVGRGGRPEPFRPDAATSELAVRASAAVGTSYAGVDLVRGRDGVTTILEVNSMPGWQGLQTVSTLDIAALLADAFLRACR